MVKDDLRNSIRRTLSFNKPSSYVYVNDYNNANKGRCKRLDSDNDYVLKKNNKLYQNTVSSLKKKKALFEIKSVPPRPRAPSNTQIFEIYKKRKAITDNVKQTQAVLYLLKHNYKLTVNPKIEELVKIHSNVLYFEPYMAIELAENLCKQKNEDYCSLNNTTNLNICNNPEHHTVNDKVRFFNNTAASSTCDSENETDRDREEEGISDVRIERKLRKHKKNKNKNTNSIVMPVTRVNQQIQPVVIPIHIPNMVSDKPTNSSNTDLNVEQIPALVKYIDDYRKSIISNSPKPTAPIIPQFILPNNQVPDNQVPDNQVPNNQVPDNQVPDNQVPDNQVPNNPPSYEKI